MRFKIYSSIVASNAIVKDCKYILTFVARPKSLVVTVTTGEGVEDPRHVGALSCVFTLVEERTCVRSIVGHHAVIVSAVIILKQELFESLLNRNGADRTIDTALCDHFLFSSLGTAIGVTPK